MVDDVQLPPWASTPEEFVRIHRMVSKSLTMMKSLLVQIVLLKSNIRKTSSPSFFRTIR